MMCIYIYVHIEALQPSHFIHGAATRPMSASYSYSSPSRSRSPARGVGVGSYVEVTGVEPPGTVVMVWLSMGKLGEVAWCGELCIVGSNCSQILVEVGLTMPW